MIGKKFGRYTIEQQIGQGAMANVYLAYDASLARHVAFKILLPKYADKPDYLERFKKEARAVGRLVHQNIVQVYDFEEHADASFIVMEYVEGKTLENLLASLKKPIDKINMQKRLALAAQVASELALAIDYAHQKELIHRDIKPSNIMISDLGEIKLMDFGLVKIIEEPFTPTQKLFCRFTRLCAA